MSPVFLAGIGAPLAVLVVAGSRRSLSMRYGRPRSSRSALSRSPACICGSSTGSRAGRTPNSKRRSRKARGAWGLAFSALYRRARSRNRHQRDLATTIERFRSAVEALPDGMVILDDGEPHPVGQRRARRRTLDSISRRTSGNRCTTSCASPKWSAISKPATSPTPWSSTSLREPGTTLSIQVVPFGVEERLLISRNITQLEAVARMRRDFIANVSHELKTPLTVVSGFLETLQDLELEPRQRARYLQLMAEQARSMQRLVDDLLTLSALESDQNVVAETEIDVVPLLLEVSADAKALSADRHTVALDIVDPATAHRAAATSSRAPSATS